MSAPAPIGIKSALKEAVRMKSGLVGFGILASLIIVAAIVPFYAPYDVVRNWSRLDPWQDNPRYAAPEWSEIFSGGHQPRTTIFEPDSFRKNIYFVTVPGSNETFKVVNLTKSFYWDYDNFPSELSIAVNGTFSGQSPLIEVGWLRESDGQFVSLLVQSIPDSARNRSVVLTQTSSAITQIRDNIRTWVLNEGVIDQANVTTAVIMPEVALFARNDTAQLSGHNAHLQKGFYELIVKYTSFNNTDDVNGRLILYGTVYGIAGTDDKRRDLLTGLLWGAPIALAFGVAAGGVVGALSGWYGGPIDTFVQRFADFYLIIPTLPILIMISLFYRPGIVALLFYLVAFGIVGSTTKVVRSIVLQIKEEQFIEAAQSYGASRGRILFKYIIPRIMPYTFALVALSVPAFIFVEASLSFLGLGDPVLPTWGSIIGQAYDQGALFYGWWWWILFPAGGIIYTTIGFALLGYAFDKVLNPRLREE